jgi:hypothetical protein
MNEIGATLGRSGTNSFCGVFRKSTGETASAFPVAFQHAKASGVYHPEILKSMRLAFNLAWNNVSSRFEDPETARHILAVQILHHADQGQHKVGSLAAAAADGLLALTRAPPS